MAKKIVKVLKMELPGGDAHPGPKLASAGVPVIITAYEDKSYDFVIKTTPVADLLLKAAGISKGSGDPKKNKVGHISQAQLEEIAQYKMPDLNANDIEAAKKVVAGSARQMGIVVDDK